MEKQNQRTELQRKSVGQTLDIGFFQSNIKGVPREGISV